MGLRFQQRFRIFKGLTLNVSKTGISWTVGGPGAAINFRRGKKTGTVGIPGTGLSYRASLDDPEQTKRQEASIEPPHRPSAVRGWLWIALLALIIYLVF